MMVRPNTEMAVKGGGQTNKSAQMQKYMNVITQNEATAVSEGGPRNAARMAQDKRGSLERSGGMNLYLEAPLSSYQITESKGANNPIKHNFK